MYWNGTRDPARDVVCDCKTMLNILPTAQISPHAMFHFLRVEVRCSWTSFASEEDVCGWVRKWFTSFLMNGISRLVSQWDKCTNNIGDYFLGNKCYFIVLYIYRLFLN